MGISADLITDTDSLMNSSSFDFHLSYQLLQPLKWAEGDLCSSFNKALLQVGFSSFDLCCVGCVSRFCTGGSMYVNLIPLLAI